MANVCFMVGFMTMGFSFYHILKKTFYTAAWKRSHLTLEAMVAILLRKEVPQEEVHEELGRTPWMCLEVPKAKQ